MRRTFGTAAAMGLVLSAASLASAQTPSGRDWMWNMGWGWGGMMFGTLAMLLFLAGIVVLTVLLVRWLSGGGGSSRELPAARRTAFDILQERFAKGEIDKQEYEEKKRVLKGEG